MNMPISRHPRICNQFAKQIDYLQTGVCLHTKAEGNDSGLVMKKQTQRTISSY